MNIPNEPVELRISANRYIAESPSDALQWVRDGSWIADELWPWWQVEFTGRGVNYDDLRSAASSYSNELRLWVVGERQWSHVAQGLAGRALRRAPKSQFVSVDLELESNKTFARALCGRR